MKTSHKIYQQYLNVRAIESNIENLKDELDGLEVAVKIAEMLSDKLFECVGKSAAYEIHEEYNNDKTDKQ